MTDKFGRVTTDKRSNQIDHSGCGDPSCVLLSPRAWRSIGSQSQSESEHLADRLSEC
jgi:hypothetical protein